MKLFGKELFNFKKEPEQLYNFYQWLNATNEFIPIAGLIQEVPIRETKKKKVKKEEKIYITPKGIYQMEALNDNKFFIKTDREYLTQQIADAKYKLEVMYGSKTKKPKKNEEWGAVRYGKQEVESIIERLQNRFRIDEFKEILEKYPHTTNDLLEEVIRKNSNLQCKNSEGFVPDFPREAIEAMKEYNEMCIKLCNKKTWFYVIAERKDQERVSSRRDPILLAQSPFGFFWQILGAWDKEMIYLGDL